MKAEKLRKGIRPNGVVPKTEAKVMDWNNCPFCSKVVRNDIRGEDEVTGDESSSCRCPWSLTRKEIVDRGLSEGSEIIYYENLV